MKNLCYVLIIVASVANCTPIRIAFLLHEKEIYNRDSLEKVRDVIVNYETRVSYIFRNDWNPEHSNLFDIVFIVYNIRDQQFSDFLENTKTSVVTDFSDEILYGVLNKYAK